MLLLCWLASLLACVVFFVKILAGCCSCCTQTRAAGRFEKRYGHWPMTEDKLRINLHVATLSHVSYTS